MTTAIFDNHVVTQIERYSELWLEQMPKHSGLSFRIQFVNQQYRTVVLGFKSKSDIVCTEVRDLIDFSPLAPTPDAGWNPSLLDKYAFMLQTVQPELTFTADTDVFTKIQTMLADVEDFKQVDVKALFALLKLGKFSLDIVLKANQHPKLIYNAIKAKHALTQVGPNSYCLFVKKQSAKEVETVE